MRLKGYILLIASIFVSFLSNAQYTETTDITPLGFSGNFQYVAYGKDNGIIAIADNNCIYTSKDTCKTWNVQKAPIDSIRGLIMAEDQTTGFIYNLYQIYKTVDGGKTWSEHKTNGIPQVIDKRRVEYRNFFIKNIDTLFFIITNRVNGMRIYMSVDNGDNWTEVAKDMDGNSYFSGIANMCFVTSNHGFAFGTAGFYAETKDGGLTWEKHVISHLTYFYDGIKCGDGTMIQVYDGSVPDIEGVKWVSLIESYKMCSVANKIIILDSDGLRTTQDMGTTWKQVELSSICNDMIFLSEKVGVVVGRNLISYVTIDGGEIWTKYVHGGGEGINEIYAKNEEECFLAGSTGRMFHTKDGGETWTWQDIYTMGLKSITFPSQDTGYVISKNVLLMTTDGGDTWVQKTNKYNCNLVDFINTTTGYMGFYGASSHFILKTTNKGDLWEYEYNSDYIDNVKASWFDFRNENEGLVTGKENLLLHTTDGGQHWEIKEVIPNKYYVRFVQNVSDKGWLIAAIDDTVSDIFFCDNDFNCQMVYKGESHSSSFDCINDSVYYLSIDDSEYVSHDFGITWEDAGFQIIGSRSYANEHLAYSFDFDYNIRKTYINVRNMGIIITQVQNRQLEIATNIAENISANVYLKDANGNLYSLFSSYEIKKDVPFTINIPHNIPQGIYSLYIESLNSAYHNTESEPFEVSDETSVLDISKNQTYRVQGKTLYIYDSNAKLYSASGVELPVQHGYIELKTGVYMLVNGNENTKIIIK